MCAWFGCPPAALCGTPLHSLLHFFFFFFLAQTKMSRRSLLTLRHSRQPLGIVVSVPRVSLKSLCLMHSGKPAGVAVSHWLTWFQTQLILTTCDQRGGGRHSWSLSTMGPSPTLLFLVPTQTVIKFRVSSWATAQIKPSSTSPYTANDRSYGLPFHLQCSVPYRGHEATDTGLAYAPVSQAHGHHHSVQCFALLHRSADLFSSTPGGL